MRNMFTKDWGALTLLRFTFPTIIMMVFMSLYSIVDGVFIARFVGTDALSAANIVYPIINIVIGIAIMLAAGGSAIIAKKIGEGKKKEACSNFSLLVLSGLAAGTLLAVVCILFLNPLVKLLGATERLLDYSYEYAFYMTLFAPVSIVQMIYQYLFVTAGKPNLGLGLTVLGGLTNIGLDYLMMGPMGMGVRGAAIATGIGYLLPAVIGSIYFLCTKGMLYFEKPKIDWKILLKSCTNGSSEMVTNLATGVTTLLFNLLMLQYLGEDGVAAITIVLYAQFLLTAVYLGFSSGTAPIISYHYGAGNQTQLQRLFRISMGFIGISSVLIFAASLILCRPVVAVFSPVGSPVFSIAVNGFLLFAFSYLTTGFNIFSSSMFTAYSDGRVSAIISFARTFIFTVLGMAFLPKLLGANGIWLAIPFAELVTLLLSAYFLIRYRHIYGYVQAGIPVSKQNAEG